MPDIVESFCVLGTADDHINKIKQLQSVGVTQYNIYLDNGDEEHIIDEYGSTVIPAFGD